MNKVSIIMGVYNSEKTLKTSIDSILNQTLKEWIFIICDDGSTDNTYCILEKYLKEYPDKFLILKNSYNYGLTKTLNKCLGFVNTEYVARMDSDDIAKHERLQKQIEFLEQNKQYAFVGSSINKFDENGTWLQMQMKECPSKKDLLWNSAFAHPTIIIRTEILKSVNGYRDTRITERCEDYDLWLRLYAMDFKGYNLKKPLLDYYESKLLYDKKKYSYKVNEACVRFQGYCKLGLMPIGILFAVKPLILGLLQKILQKKYLNMMRGN